MSFPRGAVAWSVIVILPCASHAPWYQVSGSGLLVMFCCRVAVLYVSSSQSRGLVCDVTFSCASRAPWDQVSDSGLLVMFCCRVAVLYVSFSRCRGLVCDCGISQCLPCPLGFGEPFRSSSCVLLSCGCKCYMSLPHGAVAWSVIVILPFVSLPLWIRLAL